jgi:hypothetical protein
MGVTVGVEVDTGVGVRVGGKGVGVSVGTGVKVGTGEKVGSIVGLIGTSELVGVGLIDGTRLRHASRTKDIRSRTMERCFACIIIYRGIGCLATIPFVCKIFYNLNDPVKLHHHHNTLGRKGYYQMDPRRRPNHRL